jgi:hypothetical protein
MSRCKDFEAVESQLPKEASWMSVSRGNLTPLPPLSVVTSFLEDNLGANVAPRHKLH